MEADEQKHRAGKKATRRSRRSPNESSYPEEGSTDEIGNKQMKHQISFLLNQAHNSVGASAGLSHASASSAQRSSSSHVKMEIDSRGPLSSSGVGQHENPMNRGANRRDDRSTARSSSSERKRRTCDTCGKTFAQPADLKKHIKCVHLKQRPFKCEQCTAAFGERGNLKIIKPCDLHLPTISDKERPWVCLECGLPFAFRDTLTRHVRAVHEDIRPFPCPFCASFFKKRDHLLRHQEALHDIRKPRKKQT